MKPELILDSIPFPSLVLDSETNIISHNHQVENLFEYSSKELIGKKIPFLTSPITHPQKDISEIFQKKIGLKKSGEKVLLNWYTFHFSHQDSHSHLIILFPQSQVQLICDQQLKVIDAHSEEDDYLGYSKEEIQNLHLENFFFNSKKNFNLLVKYISNDEKINDRAVVLSKKNGEKVLYSLNMKKNEQDYQFTLTTLSYCLGGNLTNQFKQLILVDPTQEIEEIRSILSHDLSTPLRHIANYSSIFNESSNSDTSSMLKIINLLSQSCKKSQQLLSDLVQYIKIGIYLNPLKSINVADEIQEIIHSYTIEAQKSNIEFLVKAHGEFVLHDGHFYHLVKNLIGNAVKFRKQNTKTTIEIDAYPSEKKLFIKIKDNGLGIKKDFQRTIFVPFQRLPSSQNMPGTGIGLSICKKITSFYGGEISINSEENVGSTFIVTLPQL